MANLQPLAYWRFGTLDTSAFAFDYLQGYYGYYQTATPGSCPAPSPPMMTARACSTARVRSTPARVARFTARVLVHVSPDMSINFTEPTLSPW